jgi:hypothetical protein
MSHRRHRRSSEKSLLPAILCWIAILAIGSPMLFQNLLRAGAVMAVQ